MLVSFAPNFYVVAYNFIDFINFVSLQCYFQTSLPKFFSNSISLTSRRHSFSWFSFALLFENSTENFGISYFKSSP